MKLIWVVVGANGDGTIQFGPVATDCAIRRVFFQGTCYPPTPTSGRYAPTAAGRRYRTR
uniref:CAZy families CBM13 protein n=1 Tax=uncultured Stackebrandtia sp. TaxID=670720 RepID=A0A060BM08_9ACTN|nr:CAZy families CBM13 protein [uncultured Stackebrandtia sp.]